MKIKGHSFYQHSIFSALMAADLYGSISFEELLKHGDFGIGTFHATDGELILLDSVPYQILSSGKVNIVANSTLSPFATITKFTSDLKLDFANISYQSLAKELEAKFPSLNIFYAIKVTGNFEQISLRSLTKQNEPFVSLKEASKEQEEIVVDNISGDLVMFYAPNFANQILVAGFHAHFISSDRKTGGHVFAFQAKNISVEVSYLTNMDLHLPTTSSFLKHQLDISSLQQDIKAVESQSKNSR